METEVCSTEFVVAIDTGSASRLTFPSDDRISMGLRSCDADREELESSDSSTTCDINESLTLRSFGLVFRIPDSSRIYVPRTLLKFALYNDPLSHGSSAI